MSWVEDARAGRAAVWLRPDGEPSPPPRDPLRPDEVEDARDRFARFAPVLAALFPGGGWDGLVRSSLLAYPAAADLPALWVKADHALPMTGSVKARGGVHELLHHVERWAAEAGVVQRGGDLSPLADLSARAALRGRCVVVASTGNLGFSIGVVARAFGVQARVHMSQDAKAWKKDRLRAVGAEVVEHAGDYGEAVARARAAAEASGDVFIDDERSRLLFAGYAAAAGELAAQLDAAGIVVDATRPLVVYLPCGVGGAPGGIAAGLKAHFGEAAVCVTVEPTASPCLLAALADGGRAVDVYDLGFDNRTIADGLAVARASDLVLDAVGGRIDAAVAVADDAMLGWVRRAWREAGLRLEPAAAAALAGIAPFLQARLDAGRPLPAGATHVAWTTGGGLLPDAEFRRLLDEE